MSKQLHKNFTDEQVKLLLKSYVDKEIEMNYILQMLKIKRRRFFYYQQNIVRTHITFLFSMKEKPLIER